MQCEHINDSQEDTNLPSAVAAGAKELTVTEATATGVTRGAYADGYMVVVANTGRGQIYKIRDNSAVQASGTTLTFYLYDEIVTALDITSDVVFTKNPFDGVRIGTASKGIQGQTLGTNLIPLTASYYFWLQTWGWASLLRGDSTGQDKQERILTPHASGCSTLTTSGGVPGAQNIGYHVYDSVDGVSGEWELSYLRCVP
jgi:hypothetical protein